MSQYLVLCKTLLPAPPEVMDAFIAQCDYMDKLKSEGKITAFVPFSGINGGFFVADVPSNEELSRRARAFESSQIPGFPIQSILIGAAIALARALFTRVDHSILLRFFAR